MPITIPTTQQLIDQFRAYLEARLNQNTPASEKAFNNVVSVDFGLAYTTLFKYAADRILAVLARTAKDVDLDVIGAEYDTPRNQATACVLSITLTGTNGTVIPAGTVFVGIPNAALYISQAAGTIAAGTVTLSITAQIAGVDGNLDPADTLTLQNQIAGATGIPTVASVTTTGADAEGDDAYRVRVLDAQQAQATGSNAASYRLWAQGVAGVVRAFPYAGSPVGSGVTSEPIMRTVYVECDSSIQADGIAPAGLLTQVRTAITTNPDTGLARQDLGLTDGTLYIQAITRIPVYVQVSGLNVPSGQTAQCQAAISAALTTYFLSISPFITGVDPSFGRNDSITNPSVSKIVQAVLVAFGASAINVLFGLSAGTFLYTYTVAQGEKAKLGAVAYV
jgi:phage-related baseplate assembly protein